MLVSQPSPSTLSNVQVNNPYDFGSIEEANTWNGLHQMTVPTAQVPPAVQKIMFLKAGTAFINNVFLDFTGGATSTDIQLSIRDNAGTSGDFQNSGTGTIPVFSFPTTATYGTPGRNLQVTLLRTGRFNVGLRIIDNGGNYSLFEMEWIVL